MSKTFFLIVVLILVTTGAFILTENKTGKNLNDSSPASSTTNTPTSQNPINTNQNPIPKTVTEIPTAKPKPKTVSIIYGINGYIPSQAFINVGDTVQFNNLGKSHMWPASDNYPNHEIYPEFDSKTPIAPAKNWSFTFVKTGVWNYHDHVTPIHKATITVKE